MTTPSSLSLPPAVQRVRELLRERVADRRWVVTADVLPGTNTLVGQLQELGADAVFALAGSQGTGPGPSCARAELGVRAGGLMEGIRVSQAALEAPLPEAVQTQLDAFDPTREARVLRCLFASDAPVGGRAAWGSRPRAWRELEDKTTVDALWDAVGVPRAPAELVAPSEASAAHRRLDQGAGTVWALDNTEGWHGGAHGLRWLRRAEDCAAAVDWAEGRARTLRVMPFLEGVPCSIHGIVFPDHVVALRPCEMVVLRRPGTLRFTYAQAATFWDPAPDDRAAMREVVRRVGLHLRESVGYRGVFTVDGVLSQDGFRPTELNPRFGGAIGKLAGALPELPLYLLHLALVEEARTGAHPADWGPEQLESVILEAADRHRRGGAMQFLDVPREATESLELVCDGGWRLAAPDEPAHAEVRIGPASTGGIVLVSLSPDHTPVGEPVAPRVVEIFACLDAVLGLGVGPLEAARAVR